MTGEIFSCPLLFFMSDDIGLYGRKKQKILFKRCYGWLDSYYLLLFLAIYTIILFNRIIHRKTRIAFDKV